MPFFDVQVIAYPNDGGDPFDVGQVTVEADDTLTAADRAHDALWDERLRMTCGARFKMTPHNPAKEAAKHIDAAPESTESVDEYHWHRGYLAADDFEKTGMKDDFDAHAERIGLDPSRSDLSIPVVVSFGDGEKYPLAIWDGVHRIMSAIARGEEKIPAIIGRKKVPAPTRTLAMSRQ